MLISSTPLGAQTHKLASRYFANIQSVETFNLSLTLVELGYGSHMCSREVTRHVTTFSIRKSGMIIHRDRSAIWSERRYFVIFSFKQGCGQQLSLFGMSL